jgi:hypothetical protein
MAIDPDAKRNLDIRLAKGEISKQEYLSLCKLLNAESPKDSLIAKAVESAISFKNQISESRKRINPTDLEPYRVTEKLVLYGDQLESNGVKHPYAKIKTILYKAFSQSINLIPTYHLANIWINLEGGRIVSESMSSTLLKGKKFNRILNAYDCLTAVTFKQRLEPYVRSLEAHGYCEHGETKIYRNGDVEANAVRVNLKVARKNKGLAFGSGSDTLANYDVITINETGGIFSQKKLKLKLSSDQDVVKNILLWLSEQP